MNMLKTIWNSRVVHLSAVIGPVLLLMACSTPQQRLPLDASVPYQADRLLPGDAIRVVFPGLAGAGSAEEFIIPASGKINLVFAGEYMAAGKSIAELEQEILDNYGSSLAVPEVTVTLVASSAAVYVSGAVQRPGKFPLNRPMTLVEAIMEAGGASPDRARLDRVSLLRYEDGTQKIYTINLKRQLRTDNYPVYLRPGDTITVPVRVFNL